MNNPFKDYDSEENRKAYEIQQRQRTLERRIRKTKREVMGLKEAVDGAQSEDVKNGLELDYQKKCALLKRQNEAYNEFCKNHDLKRLEDRLSVARWDRKQAAASIKAVKEYEKRK